ncbi:MAG: RDD family protein [Pseudomonadota bacterium]
MTRPPSARKLKRQTRKARRADRTAAAGVILPPEGVPIHLPVAGVGVRLSAQIADILITSIAAVCFVIFLSATGLAEPRALSAIFMLLFFMIRIPYYVMAELAWNGQTLGKKWMKIKVVAHDGRSLSTHALVLRNLMKEAEVFLPGTLLVTLDEASPVTSSISLAWIAMALAIPLIDPHRRRLGDMMAGTHVVHLPQPILLKDLASEKVVKAPTTRERFAFLPHQLDHYGAFELQTLERVLRAETQLRGPAAHERNRQTILTIVDKIRSKISYPDPVAPDDASAFLRAFYNAQRAHLEQRQLFGDRRADKHHAAPEAAPPD